MLHIFKELVLPFVIISLISAGIVAIIRIDFFILENNLIETSLTEYFQLILLFTSIGIYAWSANKIKESQVLYLLTAGFFGCMFLRELDYYFDMVFHGFWLYPTLLLAITLLIYGIKNRYLLKNSAQKFSRTSAYCNILVGLVIILVFSRLYGSGTLWRDIMDDNYHHIYKTVIQEPLELFGYLFIFIGSLYQYKMVKKNINEDIAA